MSETPLKVIAGAPDKPLVIGDIEIPCYVLEGETRVLSQRGMTLGVGLNPDVGFRMPQFMGSRAIKPFVSKDLMPALKSPILFKNPVGGGNAYGYPAPLLVDVCNAVLSARDAGVLAKAHHGVARHAELLIRGLATVGIIALVDEATGYQEIKEKRALATILERIIAKELQPWTKTFPYEFYRQIARLKGWPAPDRAKKPSFYGHYTNDFVYSRLAPVILEELRKINPVIPEKKRRRAKHHQWFTPEFGHPKLREHLAAIIALMRAAPNWDRFKTGLVRAFPKKNENLSLLFDE